MASSPPSGMSGMQLLDCTLRDGSYAVDFQFDEGFVTYLLSRLNETPIPLIEVGHGIGLEAERAGIRAGNIDHYRWCEIAQSSLPDKSWGMFAQPDFSRLDTIAELSKRGMSFVRVGMEPDRVADQLDYLHRATEVCGQVYLNLMKSSATPVQQLLDMLDGASPALAGIYIVDSYGAMLPADVDRYVSAVREHFPVVGFHGHDNLGMANINSITALQAGATVVDATLNGIGRGSGNAATESLAGIIKILDSDLFDYRELAKLAECCRVNMDVIREDRTMQVLGGVIGIHSGFFPLVEELAAKYRMDPARLMQTAVDIAEQSPRGADFHAAASRIADEARMLDQVSV
ncbi:MAG: 4-hydroxy 2-oxovalerate aldolase [Blastocatellia bacterium]|nr:4-hydroxy 2-oxovalerate aldolase [Blastocatellia bacterium]